ncbi:alpha-E domain-containing protein [Neobacillus cucumis]|uniref:alpha-E domain-containing protein n=1 Tax=Neobacillus cucumis TaxID=1740721 RepID=UPI00203EB7A8|nr:alpha-E domain-containing protein [Neobacillus cucumis]MCM3729667.1 alpha-E domain-containing protein [Neobacillus cucumis]
MMNRCAELLFWVGRYMERAENHTRLIDVNYHMRHELKGIDNNQDYIWERLVSAIGDVDLFKTRHLDINETSVLEFLTFDRRHANSIFSCIQQTRTNMRALRQLLPSELWDTINDFFLWLKEQTVNTVMIQSPHMFYQRVREWISLFNGIAESVMVRGMEWNFIQAGKYLERAENTVRILHSIFTNFIKDGFPYRDKDHYNRMIVLLKSVGGYEAFRKLQADEVTFTKVTEFMMLNPGFPRSVHFALTSLDSCLNTIKQQDYHFAILSDQAIQLTAQIKATLAGGHPEFDGLVPLNDMLISCHQLGIDISKTFFQEETITA